jgi:glycosyltransferase involved in cell wall biosynthesis
MVKGRVSVIIPSRNEPHTLPTVRDLLKQARGDVEIVLVLDGWWLPHDDLKELARDPRVHVIHHGAAQGLRPSLNAAATLATGEFLMKIDAHCAVDEAYDEKLKADCDVDWIVVPSKFSLDPIQWVRFKPPWNYFFLTFPYDLSMEHIGLHDKNYGPTYNYLRRRTLLDDIISFQGSCWFLPRAYFWKLLPNGMDHAHYYFAQEPQELGLSAWLSGGQVKVNKKVWYAHLHKGRSEYRRGFPRYKGPWKEAIRWSAQYWMGDQYPARIHDMAWLVQKFWPMPGWPEDWQDPKYAAAAAAKGM